MSCPTKNCSGGSDCFIYGTGDQKDIVIGNHCCDPNNNCLCFGGKCVSSSCADNSYCKSTFGDNCACVGGICTCQPCSVSTDCPDGMTCNAGICSTKSCASNSACGDWMKCENGYCVRYTPVSSLVLLIFIIAAVVACVVAYIVYKKHT